MPRYARVAVAVAPAHLDRPFDYRIPPGTQVAVGQQVRVVFAGGRRTGWVLEVGENPATEPDRIRDLALVQGAHPLFDTDDLPLYRWVADRWCGALADVLRHALPDPVAAVDRAAASWHPPAAMTPAPRPPCPATAWRPYAASRLLRSVARPQPDARPAALWWRALPGDDQVAMACDLLARCLAAGRGALVLVPDPSVPLGDAALRLAGSAAADLRVPAASGARKRYEAFLRLRLGHARVAVGERSAVFAPVRDLGLVLVWDEGNPAYKERRAPRHHARDVALARARMAGATCVLTGDLPSARLWQLLGEGHVEGVDVDRGTERARAPRVEVVDLGDPLARRARLSLRAARVLSQAVRAGGAAVVVASRGGQGAALACRDCRHRHACPVCAGAVRAAAGGGDEEERWACPSCGWEGEPMACPVCGGRRTAPLAAGAGRYAQELARSHPGAEVVRMEGFDAPGPRSRPAIGVMTRGSVVARPAWLGRDTPSIVLPDADAMLRRPALDAAEDALRLWFAVARWAVPDTGPAAPVVLQTREPNHPAVQALVRWDPAGFWEREALWRAELRYPPAASLVRVDARRDDPAAVAGELRSELGGEVEVLGPDLSGAILVKTATLRTTLDSLRALRRTWSKAGRNVRVDVDPVDLG